MAEKKKNKYNTWSEPKIVGPKRPPKPKLVWDGTKWSIEKPKKRPSIPAPKRPPYAHATDTDRARMARKAEMERRGMAATRKRQQAGRPAPMTRAQVQAVRDRDLDAAAKAARQRARKGR